MHANAKLPPVHIHELVVRALDERGEELVVDDFLIRKLTFEERICKPYELELHLATDDVNLQVAALVGGRCSLRIGRADFERTVHGIVWKAETIGIIHRRLRCVLHVRPAMQALALSRRTRIFQGLTALEIVQGIVREAHARFGGGLDARQVATLHFRKRDYCVQYEETDLQFVERLLAEEGVSFAFRHDGETETLVLLHFTAAAQAEPRVVRTRAEAFEETVRSFTGSTRMRSAQVEVSMWDWKARPPTRIFGGQVPFDDDREEPPSTARFGEIYAHERERPVEEEDGRLYVSVDLEAHRIANRVRGDDFRAHGAGTVLGFSAGHTFELVEHPTRDLDGIYLLLDVTHEAELDLDEGAGTGQATQTYRNRFNVVRVGEPGGEGPRRAFTPPRLARPRVRGPMMATVVGPRSEEVHTDEHGRIKVWMHWDREGEARGDHDTSCWVPVAHAWAGPGYGAVFTPRVGMEVVIAFVGDDPDRPLCTGVVFNGANRPPYPLPEAKTRSVIRTASSPGGDGFNELSFEDAAGSEEIFLHAQRNLRQQIRASETTSVGASRSVKVGNRNTRAVGKGELIYIGEGPTPSGDQTMPDGSRQVFVDGDEYHDTGGIHGFHAKSSFSSVDEYMHLASAGVLWLSGGSGPKAYDRRPPPPLLEMTEEAVKVEARTIDLQASETICLSVGDTKITIVDGKISIEGAVIEARSTSAALTMTTCVEVEGVEVTATGGTTSRLALRGGEASMTGAAAKVVSSTKTTIRSDGDCVLEATKSVAVMGHEVATEATKLAAIATGEHVVKWLPVRIN